MLPLYGSTAQIRRPIVEADAYGDPTTDAALEPVLVASIRCHVQEQGGTKDRTDPGRKTLRTVFKFWADYLPIEPTDVVVWEGRTLQLDGPPVRWKALGLDYVEFLASEHRG
jgi:hypothetical protein